MPDIGLQLELVFMLPLTLHFDCVPMCNGGYCLEGIKLYSQVFFILAQCIT